MSVPEHLCRFPTAGAIASLAARFGFPNTPDMQDWEWEVADQTRIDEFISAYRSGELTDDERFTLMETILQSFEELDAALRDDARWTKLLEILETNVEIHIHSIWYWSDVDNDLEGETWRVTPFLREILGRQRPRFESPPKPPES